MNQKKLITILATITIIAILSVSLFFTQFSAATATTYNANNMTVEGVLASDSYVLFPYTKENLIFGFSKYGELINGEAKQGLEYRGLDVFANPNVLEKDWSQGWFIDIHYAAKDNSYKNVWAFAMYTDLSGTSGIGGDWQEGCTGDPTEAPHGGRKTNAWATTDSIKVLYDGPRRFVALTKTTLYGASTKTADDALVSITITFVFNKDKKVVTLFKDIKRLDVGKFGRTFQVEFSNRGEWDIGTTSAPPSYAHFYDDLSTLYDDYEYHDFYSEAHPITGFDVCQMINKAGTYVGFAAFWPQLFGKLVDGTGHITPEIILNSLSTVKYNQTWESLGSPSGKNITWSYLNWDSADSYPRGAGEWSDEPMVFKNGKLLSGAGADYTWNGTKDEIVFKTEPLDTDYITVVYKHQVPDEGGEDDMNDHIAEPKTPYVIGEWCFDLEDVDQKRQFRAVTVYGLTDRHDADDDNTVTADKLPLGWSSGANVIDCEVQYYLNETFNPYDLYSAVEKQESRWLYYDESLAAATSYITLSDGIWGFSNFEVGAANESSEYDVFGYNYQLEFTTSDSTEANDDWRDTLAEVRAFTDFSYEQNHTPDKYWSVRLKSDAAGDVESGVKFWVNASKISLRTLYDNTLSYWSYLKTQTAASPYNIPTMYLKLDTDHDGVSDVDLLLEPTTTTAPSTGWIQTVLNGTDMLWDDDTGALHSLNDYLAGNVANVTISVKISGDSRVLAICFTVGGSSNWAGTEAFVDDVSFMGHTYNFEDGKLIPSVWVEYCSFAERVLLNDTLIRRYPTVSGDVNATWVSTTKCYQIDFTDGTITFKKKVSGSWVAWSLSAGTKVKVLYSTGAYENDTPHGRYEWMVVGKDAASIDSIGAAYMTEAFDSKKDIEVLLTGLDINETAAHGAYAPFVMGGAATDTKADYRDTLGRTFLRDDWCTTYPVSSSNMLFSGGPGANLGAEYFNEFTNAFWARTEYVVNDTGQAFKIFALSCWNRTSYGSGYAVISVYKDLNGTIGFLIWGVTGQDTYYATKWFWEEGIVYLQTENRGVTDIILKITYPTADPTHPTVSIANNERLGTISEKAQHDP